MSFKDQLRALLDENIDKYPDAIAWMIEQSRKVDIEGYVTQYERFVLILEGKNTFDGHPFDPDAKSFGSEHDTNPTFIPLIKWYRNKHGIGLKESKRDCEEFIYNTWPKCKRARTQIANGWKPQGFYYVSENKDFT